MAKKLNVRSQRRNELCEVKRSKDLNIKTADKPEFLRTRVTRDAVYKYRITQDIVAALDLVDERFEEISFMSEKTKELRKDEVVKLVLRYSSGVTAAPLEQSPARTIAFDDYELTVSPDFMSVTDDTVALEVFTVGRQLYSNGSRTSDRCVTNLRYNAVGLGLLLYGLDEAAKRGIKDGTIKVISDNLKTDSDTSELDLPWKESTKATNGTKSDNRVWVEYQIKDGKLVGEDKILENFRTGLAEWEEGKAKSKCSQDECKKCDLFELCTYAKKEVLPPKTEKAAGGSACNLTEEQAKVVSVKDGICVVDAGPGSGKTQSSALRVLNLLEDGVDAEDICILSFSNAAVESIKNRVVALAEQSGLDLGAEKVKIFSFNSLGNEIIQKHYEKFGFTESPALMDEVESYRLVEKVIQWDEPLSRLWDYKNPTLPRLNRNLKCGAIFGVKETLDEMRYYKGEGIEDGMPEQVLNGYVLSGTEAETLKETLEAYEKAMREANVIDFADQVILARKFMEEYDEEFLEMFSFEHVIVDEFQDSNEFQMEILRFLIATVKFESLMVVGDDAQAIYGFRGASPENLIHFEEKIGEEVKDLYLSVNHRSVKEVVDFSNGLIAGPYSTSIKPKKMSSSRGASGRLPKVSQFTTAAAETKFVAEEITKLIKAGENPSDIAVISFTRQKLKAFAKELTEAGVPNQYDLPERLVHNSKVMAAISFSEYIENPTLSNKGLLIYLNEKTGGELFEKDGSEINKVLQEEGEQALKLFENSSLEEYAEYYLESLKALNDGSDSVYASFLENIEGKLSAGKYNLNEVLKYVASFAVYGGNQTAEKDCNYEAVNLVTAHSSKGKEWKHVFVSVSDFEEEASKDGMQEKLRLLYVACTRAMDGLNVTAFVKKDGFNVFVEAANLSATYAENEAKASA